MASNPASRRNSVILGSQSGANGNSVSRRNSAVSCSQVSCRPTSPRVGVIQGMQSMTIQPNIPSLIASPLPRRPGFGSRGEKIIALTNHFQMDLSKVGDIREYVVSRVQDSNFTGHPIIGNLKRRVIELLLEHPKMKSAASDYNIKIYSIDQLTPNETNAYTYNIKYVNEEAASDPQNQRVEERSFTVVVQYVRKRDMNAFRTYLRAPHAALAGRIEEYTTAVNTLLSRFPNQTPQMTTAARGTKYFDISSTNGRVDLGLGLEAYKGYFRSARSSLSGLLLNVNTSAAAFYKEGRLDLIISEWLRGCPAGSNEYRLNMLQQHLKNLRVRIEFGGTRAKTIIRIPRIRGNPQVVPTGANYSVIQPQDPVTGQPQNRSILVNDYFSEAWPKVKRHNPHAIVLDLSTRQTECVVPSDLCYLLPGQTYKELLPHSSQTTNMINFACRRPNDNVNLILREGLPQLGITPQLGSHGQPGPDMRFNGGQDGAEKRFGIVVSKEMMKVDARGLPPPRVRFSGNKEDGNTDKGDWNLRDKKFPKSATKAHMAYTMLQLLTDGMTGVTNYDSFVREVNKGMASYCEYKNAKPLVPPTTLTLKREQSVTDVLQARFNDMIKKKVKVIFIILPSGSRQLYSDVKLVADVMCGIHTICTVRNGNSIKDKVWEIANIMLKFNLKCGGENIQMKTSDHKALLSKNTMFLGVDVSHPGNNARENAPSIASMVGTRDTNYVQYEGIVTLQRHQNQNKQSLEMVEHMRQMTQYLLEHIKATSGLPEQLIFYRDGVSDGQFAQVIAEELPRIREACKAMYLGRPLPKILLIVVQKRHHARFYRPKDSTSKWFDQNGNPAPGSVVDGEITSERFFDWYCTSHKCLQGTSRPAKYVVLHDEIGVSPDDIQMLTHHMCWLFGRATKSISVHLAARYADMLCERARVYLRDLYNNPDGEPYDPRDEEHWNGKIAAPLRNTMFFV